MNEVMSHSFLSWEESSTDLSVMIEDSQRAGEHLEKWKRTHKIPDDNTGNEIYTLERDFYFVKKALVLLYEELNLGGARPQFKRDKDG